MRVPAVYCVLMSGALSRAGFMAFTALVGFLAIGCSGGGGRPSAAGHSEADGLLGTPDTGPSQVAVAGEGQTGQPIVGPALTPSETPTASSLSSAELRQRVHEFVDRTGIDWASYATSERPWHVNAPRYDMDFGTHVARAGDFEVDVSTGDVLAASRHRGNMPGQWDFITLSDAHAKARPAKMVQEDVLARCRSWFSRIAPDALNEADLLAVQYFDERRNPWNYPWWRVKWRPRFHGHLCRHDFYQVTWFDDDVLRGFIRTVATPPAPPHSRLSASDARRLGTSRAVSVHLERELGIVGSLEKAGEPRLWWVRPLPSSVAFDTGQVPHAKRIRLAWVLLLRSDATGETCEVWVDAEDGSILGADAAAQ